MTSADRPGYLPRPPFIREDEMRSGDDDAAPYLRALLVVQLELLRQSESEVKPELLLHRAGLDMREIAGLLNKKYDAVSKAIVRAKHGRAKPEAREEEV